jgi:hypothetical protein
MIHRYGEGFMSITLSRRVIAVALLALAAVLVVMAGVRVTVAGAQAADSTATPANWIYDGS